MFIDLDGFKNVNDDYGHDIGDLLLIEVSKRITSCLSENDVASRIGGDEFTVMLPKINSVEDATTIAKTIIDVVGSPLRTPRKSDSCDNKYRNLLFNL